MWTDWGGTNKVQVLPVSLKNKRICEASKMKVVYKPPGKFPCTSYCQVQAFSSTCQLPNLWHLREKGHGLPGWISAEDTASHLITEGLCCVLSLHTHIMCTFWLGLGMCPGFLHSWCASELNMKYRLWDGFNTEQTAVYLNVTLYPAGLVTCIWNVVFR